MSCLFSSKFTDSGLVTDTENFVVGDIVYVNGDGNKRGKICYIGEVAFAKGEFAGIALDKPDGKLTLMNLFRLSLIYNYSGNHDGQVKGNRYFQVKN